MTALRFLRSSSCAWWLAALGGLGPFACANGDSPPSSGTPQASAGPGGAQTSVAVGSTSSASTSSTSGEGGSGGAAESGGSGGDGGSGGQPDIDCMGKACGDTCIEQSQVGQCGADGMCYPNTTVPCPPPPYDPCLWKWCGDSCTICDPSDPNCSEPPGAKQCDANGSCIVPAGPLVCPYQACANKLCGDPCTVCDPADPNCVEPPYPHFCDLAWSCVPNQVQCLPTQ